MLALGRPGGKLASEWKGCSGACMHACLSACVFAEQQLRLGQETDWKKWWDLSQLQTKESKA